MGPVFFFATFGAGRPTGRESEAMTMNQPTMTLQEIQRTLEAQDRELQTAYAAVRRMGDHDVVVPTDALDQLRDLCVARSSAAHGLTFPIGIRA
jgi:hypothetical protein